MVVVMFTTMENPSAEETGTHDDDAEWPFPVIFSVQLVQKLFKS
jgi:hypothetical protein